MKKEGNKKKRRREGEKANGPGKARAMIDMNWTATNTIAQMLAINGSYSLTHSQTVSLSLTPTQSGGVLWKRRVRTRSGRSLWSVISKTNVNFDAATIKCDSATMQD